MSFLIKLFSVSLVLILGISVAWQTTPNFSRSVSSWVMIALADDEDEEDEEDEDEEEEDEEEDEPASSSSSKTEYKTIEVIQEVIEYKPVTETVLVTKEDYARDTDGDSLVDAIDPDPLVVQSEYFSDTDNDGIPNALDQHHDEDDFAYFDFETDDNNNGIVDSYEQE